MQAVCQMMLVWSRAVGKCVLQPELWVRAVYSPSPGIVGLLAAVTPDCRNG